MKKRIGDVTLDYLPSKTTAVYTDGEVEEELLAIASSSNFNLQRDKALNDNPSWPIYYHLSPARGGIIDWYSFPKDARILEIGAGCGAITESLVAKNVSVTALELSPKRAEINAQRNRKAANLTIVVGNLEDYDPKEKFDYVVCIGVLEYAGTFIDAKEPYLTFLKQLHSFLKDGGKLLLAIENQLGIKYLAGAREDHTRKYYDGINDYPAGTQVRTFGRQVLRNLLKGAGFTNSYYYYPFPDYKFPMLIYSDDYYPGMDGVRFPLNLLPTPTPDGDRQFVFSEARFMKVIEQNGVFPEVSNSFLVETVR